MPPHSELTPRRGLLSRLGLDRPELRAWAMYDWANSAFMTVVITAVFPTYFGLVAAKGMSDVEQQLHFGHVTTAALACIAVLSPILGAIADYRASKKRFLLGFLILGVSATALLFFVQEGDWKFALLCFGIANIGVSGSFVFYDALLPGIAADDEMDRVSSAGYAIGYLGGGLLLVLSLAVILKPALIGIHPGPGGSTLPTRLSFLATAVWWAVFAIPLFRRVPEPPLLRERDESLRAGAAIGASLKRLGETFRELRLYRYAFLMLIAAALYGDGINTIIRMAPLYAASTAHVPQTALIGAIVMVQFVGIPFAFLFGAMASRLGTKRSILIGVAMYGVVSVMGYFMRTTFHFYALAFMVGMVQGGTQALSRSLFATLIPRHKAGEFFGIYAIFERFGAILGPFFYTTVLQATHQARYAILSIIVFFAVGAVLLWLVNVAEGQRVARRADEGVVRA